MTLYHDFIFLYDLKFQVAVACSRCLESAVQREVREHEKKRGGREGEGEKWEYPTLPHPLAVFPTHISLSHPYNLKTRSTLKWL